MSSGIWAHLYVYGMSTVEQFLSNRGACFLENYSDTTVCATDHGVLRNH